MSKQAKKQVQAPEKMPHYAYDESDKGRLLSLLCRSDPPLGTWVSFLCSQVPPDYKDSKGNNAVHLAAQRNIRCIPMMVKGWGRTKVDDLAHAANDYKRNALHLAASAGHASTLLHLLPKTFAAIGA